MRGVLVGGMEGGGTSSTLVLIDERGKEISRVHGPDTNHWTIGMSECQKRIADMVNEAKAKVGISKSQQLLALGLCLSGCGPEKSNNQLRLELADKYPDLAKEYAVRSDAEGSVATVAPNGGIVLISGTGSNCLLINPDGEKYYCGGWGWFLGDEGSAFWISLKAIKTVFDHEDNLVPCQFDLTQVWGAIRSHFNIDTRSDLLDHCYTNFEKNKFAGLCEKLAECATDGDALCLHLFKMAGDVLAAMILAHVPRTDPILLRKSGGLNVLCVGSVWKSWDFLKSGFIAKLQSGCLEELSLMKLTTTSALGAAYIAANAFNADIVTNYENNYEIFYHFKK